MKSDVQIVILTLAVVLLAYVEIKITREIDRHESRLEQIEQELRKSRSLTRRYAEWEGGAK